MPVCSSYQVKKENNLWSYCNQEEESITQLLFHCGAVAKFWKDLKTWLERKSNIKIKINLKSFLFSSTTEAFLNHIITIAKHYIYKRLLFS